MNLKDKVANTILWIVWWWEVSICYFFVIVLVYLIDIKLIQPIINFNLIFKKEYMYGYFNEVSYLLDILFVVIIFYLFTTYKYYTYNLIIYFAETILWVLFVVFILYGAYSILNETIFESLRDLIYILQNPERYILELDKMQAVFNLSIIGLVFYLLKKFQQFWYGFLEVTFAFVNNYLQIEKLKEFAASGSLGLVGWLIFVTSVYLVVRRINNMDDGFKKSFVGKKALIYLYKIISK